MIYPSQVQSSLPNLYKALLVTKGADSESPFMIARTQASTLDFGSTNAQTSSEKTVVFTGAKAGDLVQIQPATKTANVFYTGYVATDGIVTVRLNNYSSGSVNPASMSYVIRLTPMTFQS